MMFRTRIREELAANPNRARILLAVFCLIFAAMIARLFFVQVVSHEYYRTIADRQHLRTANIVATRGDILAHDRTNDGDGTLYPLATNRRYYEVYLNPNEVTRPINTAESLSAILGVDYEMVKARADKEHDPYEPIAARATEEQALLIEDVGLPGVYTRPLTWRYYPDKSIGSHVLGFFASDDIKASGRYGIEGYWEQELAGTSQEVTVVADGTGSIVPSAEAAAVQPTDGSDIVLTIDHTVQYEACTRLEETAERFGAVSGSLIIMETTSGKIRALCNIPTFDPNQYGDTEDVSWFNNSALYEAYEPGSVIKPLSMAIAIDQGVVTPATMYEDKGEVKIDEYTIRNFDKQAHGRRSMIEVLQQSLNLGIMFATQNVPNATFTEYMKKFGFGQATGLTISQESAGDLGDLEKNQDIFKATASFGQGFTATALQILSAINALANDGVLMQPLIVEEVRKSDGTVIAYEPKRIRQVVSTDTAQTLTAMLVQVIEAGYDDKARVPGYYLAGKTGTAQIAENGSYGSKTNHTFVGYGPAEKPYFSILIKLHDVSEVGFAADSTTALFRDLATFLLNYYKIPPTR